MAPRIATEAQLIDGLTGVLRDRGFDAATMQDISAASGLQKSSLYHRFPGGKQQMATEVAEAIGRHFGDHVLAPLRTDEPPRAQLEAVAHNLAEFYGQGRRSCVLETLSIGSAGSATGDALRVAATSWVAAFSAVARAAGIERASATARAQDAIALVEGSLVLARVLDDTSAFERALSRLPDILLSGPDQ